MVRTGLMYLLVAALVTSGPVVAAQTAAKPVPVTPADMQSVMGAWQIPLDTPNGRLVADLVFRVEDGRVVAGISARQFPEHKITDITRSGQVLVLRASTNYSGALANYVGLVTMVLRLTPKGPEMAAWFDFNDSNYQIGGTARRKA